MHDSHFVRIGEAVGGLRHDGERLLHGERGAALAENCLQRTAAHQLHDHVERAVLLVQRIKRRDVGVTQQREVLRLATKPLDEGPVVQQFGTQRFDGDQPVEHGIARGEDLAYSAFAQQLLNLELTNSATLAHGCLSKAGISRVA